MDTPTDIQAVAAEALVALDTGRQVAPFSARLSAFDLDDAYCVTTAVRKMREARGELPVGRKIGFTNRTAWTYPPMWGYVYNRTVYDLAEIGETFSLMGLAEPRIELEIVLKLAVAPAPVMDEGAALMSYWDSSALIKLYVQEFDSAAFRALAAIATRVITASLTRHEMRTVFRRREAEGERIRDLYLRKRRERMRAQSREQSREPEMAM